jgi:hypothetical protein
VLDEATISVNLLTFRQKSFAFDRSAEVGGRSYAIFARTETESESKLRPKLLRLHVTVPTEWLIYDEPSDALEIGTDGHTPGPRGTGIALEAGVEGERFDEQGAPWIRRLLGPLSVLYVPAAREGELSVDVLRSILAGPG